MRSLSEFYDRVATQSSINATLGAFRTIVFQRNGQTITLKAGIFDPSKLELMPAVSVLDFVLDEFIRAASKHYVDLFSTLAANANSAHFSVRTKSLNRLPSIVKLTQDNAFGSAVARLICVASPERNLPLISADKAAFLRSHIAFFCGFLGSPNNRQSIDATQLLKTSNTFPLTLTLASLEQVSIDITSELVALSQLTIDQNSLLNDIKNLVGSQIYETKISKLKEAIKDAERRARSPTVVDALSAAISAGQAAAQLPNLATGMMVLTSLISQIPNNSVPLYVLQKRESFAAAGEQLGKGGAAVGDLVQAIDKLQPNSNAASELNDLRKSLVEAQKEYDELLKAVQETANQHKQEYIASIQKIIELNRKQQRTVLAERTALNIAVVKEMIGGKLAHASLEALQICPKSAAAFILNPTEGTLSNLSTGCGMYSDRIPGLIGCLENSPKTAGFSVFFGGNVGFIVARDRRETACF